MPYLGRLRALCTRLLASRARLRLLLLGRLLGLLLLGRRSVAFATSSATSGTTTTAVSTTTFHMCLVGSFIVTVLTVAALKGATSATTLGAVATASFQGALVSRIVVTVLAVAALELLTVLLGLLVLLLLLRLGFCQLLLALRLTRLLAFEIRRFITRLGLTKDAGLDLGLRSFGGRLARLQRQTCTLTRRTAIAATFTASAASAASKNITS